MGMVISASSPGLVVGMSKDALLARFSSPAQTTLYSSLHRHIPSAFGFLSRQVLTNSVFGENIVSSGMETSSTNRLLSVHLGVAGKARGIKTPVRVPARPPTNAAMIATVSGWLKKGPRFLLPIKPDGESDTI